jgi:hypothetical protein
MIQPKVVLTGVEELDNALSYMHTYHANKIANMCIAAGCRTAASNIRRHIKRSIRPRTLDKGIGWRMKRGTRKNKADGKAGVAVGKAFRASIKRTGPRALWQGKQGKKSVRKGVGISAANLHWFALGTKKRYLKAEAKPSSTTLLGKTRQLFSKKPKGRYTGMISKQKYGNFVQGFGQQAVTQRMIDVAWKALRQMKKKGLPDVRETMVVLHGD